MSATTERIVLTLSFALLMALVLWAMAASWRRRARRDDVLLPLPAPSTGLDSGSAPGPDSALVPDSALGPADGDDAERAGLPGLYLGTVHAGRWTDRVVAGGLSRRAAGELRLTGEGVLVVRRDDEPILVPRTALTGAYTSPGLAGTVVGERGVLVVGWRYHGVDLESGFRADDAVAQARTAEELASWTASPGGAA